MKVENDMIHLSSLEYFLTDRCNLRCEHCSASSPYLRDANMPDVEAFREQLRCLKIVMRSEQIKFLGGEPLLNRSICEFLRAARESEIFTLIRVTTNGVLLSRMTDEFWELADIVEISRYPGVEQPDKYELGRLSDKAAQHGARLEVNHIGRFMLAVCDLQIEDRARVEQIFHMCGEANNWSCHLLYQGRLYRCSRVHTLDRYLTERGVAHDPFTESDGLPINERPGLFDDIRAYLTSPTPLTACSYCLGTSGRWVANRQLTAEQVRQHVAGPPKPFNDAQVVSESAAKIRNMITTWSAAADKIKDPSGKTSL